MHKLTITQAQAEQALDLCAGIRAYPGMYVARFDWYTVDAFWLGFLSGLSCDAVADFREWGLAHVGYPQSNTDPIFQLKRLHGVSADDARDSSLTRERATEIAALVCDLIEAYIRARQLPA